MSLRRRDNQGRMFSPLTATRAPVEPEHPVTALFTARKLRARQAFEYRASCANACRREDRGEQVARCEGCQTEVDVERPVHEPRCRLAALWELET